MELLNVNNISKYYGEECVLDGVSFCVQDNEKVGMLGVNGAGKSTLLKIILGEIRPDDGNITFKKGIRMGYLPQNAEYNSERTAYEVALDVFSDLIVMERKIDELHKLLETDPSEKNIERYTSLHDEYMQKDGMVFRAKTRSMLISLGLTETELELPVNVLSGGQKTRVLLAKLLLEKPDILFLDEPTNHLDIEAIEWLEKYLREYTGQIVIISHDRYFLDTFVNKIVEIENHHLYSYTGNYSQFVVKKQELRDALQKDYEKKQKEIKRLEDMIALQKQWNTERSIGIAAHKQHQLDRLLDTVVKPEDDPEFMKMDLQSSQRSGNDVLTVKDLSISFDNVTLFRNVDFEVKRSDRAFILGKNGIGKTTVLKMILNQLEPTSGKITLGSRVEVGYYAQGQEMLPLDKTIIEAVYMNTEEESIGKIRDVLASFMFTGDDIEKKIATLSGGERARVALTILMLSKCNFLILDEPTNHLDMQSREILEDALLKYNGTILAVSHDRYFINKISTKIMNLSSDGMHFIYGNYDDYLKYKEETEAAEAAKETASDKKTGGETYRQNKSQEAELRKKRNRIKRLEEQSSKLEAEIDDMKNSLSDPEISADYSKIMEISTEIEKLQNRLDETYIEWENLMEELGE